MKKLIVIAILLLACGFLKAQNNAADKEAVKRAVLDYVEGFYEGDTAKLKRGILPEVNKYGYYTPKGSTAYVGEPMSFKEILEYGLSVKQKNKPAPATAPKIVEVFDVQNQTASAKLTAWWGTDYLLLAQYKGKWKIVQVLWQSPPPKK